MLNVKAVANGVTDPSPATYSWRVDVTDPDGSIDNPPAALIKLNDLSIDLSCDDAPCTFECSLDDGTAAACTSPHVLTGLAEGSHRLTVFATDRAGNRDDTPATVTFVVDSTGPTVTITSGPGANTDATDITIAFACDETACTFECRIDAAVFTACSSPLSYPGLSEGDHVVEIRATDAAGNPQDSVTRVSFNVDTTDPETVLLAQPQPVSADVAPVISFDCSESTCTFQCSLDAAAFSACTSPLTLANLGGGPHLFEVYGVDEAGNSDPSPAQVSWQVDITAPDTTFTSGPGSTSGFDSATFSFACNETGCTFQCSLDSAAFAACASPLTLTGLSDGAHTFRVRAIDQAGNSDDSEVTHPWTIDTSKPDTVIGAGPAAVSADTTPELSFSCNKPPCTFECSLDTGASQPCTSPRELTGLVEGDHRFEVRGTDSVGNRDETPASWSWRLDTQRPDTTIDSGPASPTRQTVATFTFSGNEQGVTFECALDSGAYAPCTSGDSITGVTEGAHTFYVRAVDRAGNPDDPPASHAWIVDVTGPPTTISSGPPNPSGSGAATFVLSSEAGATFECKLDIGDFASCPASHSISGLLEGEHTLSVRAFDVAGNPDPSPETFTWMVDLTPPDTSISGRPTNPSNVTNPSLSFVSTETGSTFECSLDGSTFQPCTSPKQYTLFEGEHVFSVRAVDAAQTADNTPATYTWFIDTTDPQTTVVTGPLDPTGTTNAAFTFSASEPGSTFECELDGGGFAACVSGKGYSGLSAGGHIFTVRATDPAGNPDTSPATYRWNIDLTPPTTTITAAPVSPSNNPAPSFSFTSSEAGSTFTCKLDTGAFEECTSPNVYSSVGEGQHTFTVRATDAQTNLDTTGASHTWTIDVTPPDTSIGATGVPANPTNVTDATFTFTATETGSTFECSLDGAAFTVCTSPASYSSLSEASHTFRVRAIDAANNPDLTAAAHTWVIDRTPPVTTLSSTGAPRNPTNATDATFSFTSDEQNSTFVCSLDGAAPEPCTSPRSYTGLTAGDHTFRVHAIDAALNPDLSDEVFSWTIDLTRPDTTLGAGSPANPTNAVTATFTFSSEAGAGFECALDGAVFTVCTSPKDYSSLAAGEHTFTVRAVDVAGNADDTPASYTWLIDLTRPETTITSGPPTPVNSLSAQFVFSSSEPGSTFECALDGAAFTACSSPKSYTVSEGVHTFTVRATDLAGNVDDTLGPSTRTWTVDVTGPAVTLSSKPPARTNSTSATFVFSANESASFECKLDDGSFGSCTSPAALTSLAVGPHTFTVRATDDATNTGSTDHIWTIDTDLPSTTIVLRPADPSNQTGPIFGFTSDEPSTFDCSLDGSVFAACTSPKSYSGLGAGSHTFRVRATDEATNLDTVGASWTWTIDLTPPDTAITDGPQSPTNLTSVSFTFNSPDDAAATFECSLNGAVYTPCTSPHAISTGTLEGPNSMSIRAVDPAGNRDLSPDVRSWTQDTTPPDTTLVGKPLGLDNTDEAIFQFDCSDGAGNCTFQCSVDGGVYVSCTTPATYQLLDGTRSFRVRAADSLGNVDTTPDSYSWVIDTQPPFTVFTTVPANPSNDTSVVVDFNCGEANCTYSCGLDWGSMAPCTPPLTLTIGVGSHQIRVATTDAAGNFEPGGKRYVWTNSWNPGGLGVGSDSAHACVVTDSGRIKCWGQGGTGQLGYATTSTPQSVPTPVDVTSSRVWMQVAHGGSHSCGLTDTGEVYCWGAGFQGAIAGGNYNQSVTPRAVTLPAIATRVVTGADHSCAVLVDGTVRCWGANTNSQLGDQTLLPASTPKVNVATQVSFIGSTLPVAVDIAAGSYHTCARLLDDTLWCWGFNSTGQLGDGSNTSRNYPVQAGGFTAVSALTTGAQHSCAINAGDLWCWGFNNNGQLGVGDRLDRNTPTWVAGIFPDMVSAGGDHTCARLSGSRALACWGGNQYGQLGDGTTFNKLVPYVLAAPAAVDEVSAGRWFTIARAGSQLRTWGANGGGQLGVGRVAMATAPVTVSGFSTGADEIANGFFHSCIVSSSAEVNCTGLNNFGQLGIGSTGAHHDVPIAVPALGGASSVTVGDYTSCVVTAGGVKCWGANGIGQVGDGTNVDQASPSDVVGIAGTVVQVSSGRQHACARTEAGAVYCWGGNTYGQVGDGTNDNALSAKPVSGLGSGVASIASGSFFTCATTTAGALYCWGQNDDGQLGGGSRSFGSNVPVAHATLRAGFDILAAGDRHACASDGNAVKCWGYNLYSQLGAGSGNLRELTPVTVRRLPPPVLALSGLTQATCALAGDGLYCWGEGSSGRLGIGSEFDSRPFPTKVHSVGVDPVAMANSGVASMGAVLATGMARTWGDNAYGQLGDDFAWRNIPGPVLGAP